jgi:GNAT superfamily N-acetyltransferase
MQIDVATSSDVPRLAELLGILFEQEEEFTPDREAQERGLRRIIADASLGRVLVLRDEARVIGMVSLLFSVSTALGDGVATLEDMVVAPERRSEGAGSALLAAAIEHARESGCRRLTLLTDRSNASARRFYGRHGFQLSEMVPMRLHLDGPSPEKITP